MNKKQKKSLLRIIISLILLIIISIVFHLTDEKIGKLPTYADKLIHIGLYLIPYLIVGLKVLIKSAKNIAHGNVFDENFLMSIATIGAFALGEYREAAAVMIFYQIGELFENIAVNKSRTAITSLVKLRPDYANIEKEGELEKVDPEDVKIGDEIVVLAGEKIPLDGIVTEGESFIDTAALTGESVPRRVVAGDEILSGCINEQSVLKIKVTKEFGESTVSKILNMVENASTNKSRQESFITRFAKVYTPLVVLAAVIVAFVPPLILKQSFATWIGRALIFLVISCPCALVISVPLSFFGGIGAASNMGILIKGSNYLEAMAKVKTVVFDKTGTLTKGVFAVSEIVPGENMTEDKLLELAAYAEYYSNHPIAVSIKEAYSKTGNAINKENIKNSNEIAGKGIELELNNGNIVYVGNTKLLDDIGVQNNLKLEQNYGTIIYVADKLNCLGYITISDEIKPTSASAIERLNTQGIDDTVMLTGDRREAAEAVAGKLGIGRVYSELLPADKLDNLETIITDKKSENDDAMVCFVGDGINDAPSLIRADVGVAMGALGQDAAIEAADIVLMDDNPVKLATVNFIGKKTLRIVYENIVFALGVKLLAMVLGVLGIAGMWFAVFADVGVSVIAILNSMRMLKYHE
ncbi:MAG: heavy metal translocating P-type ATPase [Lachnospiraceae bacterium]|nr:heavy metal translocating P-type ATPase [Lachnospiraceae bacterium]